MIPIEVISHLSKFLSLGVRLFANLFSGHLLLKVFYSFIFLVLNAVSFVTLPGILVLIGFTAFVILLEFLIAFLQAYVALLLSTLYISGTKIFSAEH